MTLQLYSDLYFGHTSNEQAVSQSADTPVYWYQYDYRSENEPIDEIYGETLTAEFIKSVQV